MQEQALAEDPTVFQYDELYDDMDTKRKESKLVRKDLDKKPKYISRLLQTADRRKRENERRIERQVQKEREEEGNQFKDKEEFVTTAYRKKLEELKELEAAEKREEYLESIGDVRKQGDLSGFYRHLYDQKVNYEDKKDDDNKAKVEVKVEEKSRSPSPREMVENKGEDSDGDSKKGAAPEKKKVGKRRYRQRDDSASDEDEEGTKKLEHLPSNLDADSDFSIDSDDSDDEEAAKKAKLSEECPAETLKTVKEEPGTVEASVEEKAALSSNGKAPTEDVKVEKEEKKKDEAKQEQKKPKINIWIKRTVGVVFDEALQRYFERKALREVQVK